MATSDAPRSTPNVACVATRGVAPAVAAPSAPPVFTTTSQATTITANVSQANGATSYNIRVDGGVSQSGTTATGLTPEQMYSVELQGVNSEGVSAWSAGVSETTQAAVTPPANTGDPLVRYDFANGDTITTPVINRTGFSWSSTSKSYVPTPQGVIGVLARLTGKPIGDTSNEMRYDIGTQLFETYERIVLYIPTNFEHRTNMELEVDAALDTSSWQVGDEITTFSGTNGALYMGRETETAIWIKYASNESSGSWVGSLTNTTRGQQFTSLSKSNSATNNKLGIQWTQEYVSTNPDHEGLMGLEFDVKDPDFIGDYPKPSFFTCKTTPVPEGSGGTGNRVSSITGLPFIDPATDPGQLIDYVIHRRRSSTIDANDGICEVWKDGVLAYQADFPIWSPTHNWFDVGYILGYCNSGFDEDTDFIVTKYELYDNTRPEGIPAP